MLHLENVSTHYGVVPMLRDISLSMSAGELICILGPNGAGKTTMFRAMTGLLPLSSGRITILGAELDRVRTEGLAERGIGFVPEGRRLFNKISVRENIRIGYDAQNGPRKQFARRLEAMFELFPRVRDRINQQAGTLSGGEQAMVALARALIGEPALLIMDEPSLGLSPKLIEEYFETVASINRSGTSVVLIEQNAETALSIAHRGFVLVRGTIVAQGPAKDLLNNSDLRHLYL